MADDSDEDRNLPASEKRLREARERGEVPRSRELSAAAVLIAAAGCLSLLGPHLAADGAAWTRAALRAPAALSHADAADLTGYLGQVTLGGFRVVAPLLLAMLLAALLSPLALGGWNFSPKALLPDFGRISPAKGFGRMFSLQGWVELGKALVKFVLVGGIACLLLWNGRSEYLALGREAPEQAIAHGLSLCMHAFLWLALSLVLIAGVDVPWQWWNYHRRLRMTRQEQKRESQESEGRPEVRGRIRKLQQEVARRRMMQAVPTADVIVVNPIHFAVALKYAEGKMRAPRVVAKGAELVAAKIRDLAKEHRVPILTAPALARALHANTEIGDEIPVALYQAVAQVLTWVYQLRRHRIGPPPQQPEIEVPAELKQSRPAGPGA